mgnify:CR=1 FL=1
MKVPTKIISVLLIQLTLLLSNVGLAAEKKSSATVTLSTTVSGNQQQPKVLYIVPWKAPEVAAATRQSLHSQLVSVFAHVDKQALQRQLQQQGSAINSTNQTADVE